ncbi:MAG: phosphoethanolamine transferase domain-containing protein, partial [Prevotella sp.]|nr:phosphoethanolamine transferase domain-containing protein [Leyella stercorea]MDY4197673.1 phosphoethanolamine transferase domain-containing protein [Prevotella sp.]
MKKILGLLTSPRFLFFYIVLSLAVPNVALCFTEHMPVLACVANVVLPVSLYALLMTLSKKTGRQVWFLFLIVFFAAFQIVLLYLFGRGVIAVDMFLNLVTTNPGEAMELLNNL